MSSIKILCVNIRKCKVDITHQGVVGTVNVSINSLRNKVTGQCNDESICYYGNIIEGPHYVKPNPDILYILWNRSSVSDQ